MEGDNLMHGYFENLDDFEDGSRPPAVDWVEWLLNMIFATAGSAILAYVCFMMMQAIEIGELCKPR